jgi:hypothetical protein
LPAINSKDLSDGVKGEVLTELSIFKKNLKLVGVVLDGSPVVIIEDLKSKETLFMRKGDSVYGAVVDDIQEGKVIFSYQEQWVELTQ